MKQLTVNEKSLCLQERSGRSTHSLQGRQRLPTRLAGVIITVVLLSTTLLRLNKVRTESILQYGSTRKVSNTGSASFRWDAITPSTRMEYHSCFDGFQCARLEVPMDWKRSDGAGRKMAIAVIRLPAVVPVTDPRYGGPIVTNPGGPGGSGVEQVLRAGKMTQYIANNNIEPNATTSESSISNVYHDIIRYVTWHVLGFRCSTGPVSILEA